MGGVKRRQSSDVKKATLNEKPAGADHLTMDLFAPGMSPLHRAGLGGLACTLKAMERQYDAGLLKADKLPAPFDGDKPPWEIDKRKVALKFGKAEKAKKYLERLFEFAFDIRKDGLITLPGQYESEPCAAALADLQAGIVLTFLQHGKVRKLAKDPTIANYDPEGNGVPGVIVEYKKCSSFKHQDGWKMLIDKKGCIAESTVKIDGPISPGTVVRHVAFTGDTAAEDIPARMLPLYFAIVGCLPLPVNRGVAALVIPEVTDLKEFIFDRPMMTPTTAKQCQITNAADAALQAQIRLRSRERTQGAEIPGCYAMTFRPTPWASQQKSRVATIHVPKGDDRILDRFERAWTLLPPRIVTKLVKEATGRGRTKVVKERTESFRADSVIRPMIAENLALGKPWYSGFVDLMIKTNPATDRPYRNQLTFERKGLHDMIADDAMWDEQGERLVVEAVHDAIGCRLGQIRRDTDGEKAIVISQATKNRWDRFRDKLRLDLAGSKTESNVRFALMDLFSRGGINPTLREHWEKVLPVIRRDWHLARDLGLLALASYAGKGQANDENDNPETN